MELSEATWHLRHVLKQVLPPWPVVISIRTVLDALEAAAKERDELRAEVERLREALGWFLDDERFHVAVGGNPNVVQKMLHDARLLHAGLPPEQEPDL